MKPSIIILAAVLAGLSLAGCDRNELPAPAGETDSDAVKSDEAIASEAPSTIGLEENHLEAVQAGYDENWVIGYGWPGEYPNGFTVTGRQMILEGRAKPHPDAPRTVSCPMSHGATIHPWNHDRVAIDDLIFVSATRKIALSVHTEGILLAESETSTGAPLEISLEPGDKVYVERYFGEGFGQIAYNGDTYTADLQQLNELTNASDTEPLEIDEWVMLTCADKGAHRAWFLLADLKRLQGISEVAITDFGQASDLD